jgi:hypothetical protein
MKLAITRKTPIGALLYVTLIDSGLKLHEFVAAIGYSNIPKGIRAFQSFVNTGTGNPILLERLQASRLAIDSEVFLDALSQTDTQLRLEQEEERAKNEEERARAFRPTCYPVPRLDPGAQITIFAITGEFKKYAIELPATIHSWSHEAQYSYTQSKIREHYRRHQGQIHFLGAIVSYLYHRSWNEPPVALTIDGQPLGIAPRCALPTTGLRLGNRAISQETLARCLGTSDAERARTQKTSLSHKD